MAASLPRDFMRVEWLNGSKFERQTGEIKKLRAKAQIYCRTFSALAVEVEVIGPPVRAPFASCGIVDEELNDTLSLSLALPLCTFYNRRRSR